MRATDRGFKRRLRTATVDEQRLAVQDPKWGAAPHLPDVGQGRVLTLGLDYERLCVQHEVLVQAARPSC